MIDRRAFLTLSSAAMLPGPASAAEETVLRIVPQADLKILDPVWTTSQLTQAHALMVYDQLFALDSHLIPRPQMVENFSTSPDGLTWDFTFRKNLQFSDGSPVTGRDAVASLKRWAARTSDGQLLLRLATGIEATGPNAFAIHLSRPFGPMLETLANATTPLFVMREREALTDPFQQIKDVVGSGPFVFAKEEFREGNIVVYRRNPTANPRPEPADGMAGGKIAKVDRVEWHILPDIATAVSALRRGEIDLIETAPYDLLPLIEHDPSLALTVTDPLGQQAVIRMNQLFPPFDDFNIRRALLLAIDRQQYLSAMVGDPRFERDCASAFICGTASASAGTVAPPPSLDQARALVKASSYRGEPVVVLDPTDYPIIHALTLVTADRLAAIGLNVDLQAMTWSQLVARRANRERPVDGRGGWHVIHTTIPSVALISPITNYIMATGCDGKNWFGWPCDPQLEKLRLSFLDAATPDAQKAVYEAMQARFWDSLPFIPVGQLIKPIAHRRNITGLVASPILAAWNIEKH